MLGIKHNKWTELLEAFLLVFLKFQFTLWLLTDL